MPSKYVIRNFAENKYYHIFNRGVEKRKIFLDEQDSSIFLYYLLVYTMPIKKVLEKYPLLPIRLHSKNLSSEIGIIAYCLMPNHFHLLIKQKSKDAISKLLKQVTIAYAHYFNYKYKRVGGLVQGKFKAVLIENDELLLHISRYIHLNPVASNLVNTPKDYKWSSFLSYLDNSLNNDIKCYKDPILSHFNSPKEYNEFVLDQIEYGKEFERIKHLTLED